MGSGLAVPSALASGPSVASTPGSGSAGTPAATFALSPTTGTVPARVRVTLPVVACTVADGAIAGPAPTPLVSTIEVDLPASLAPGLVVYGVETEQLILGPRGWRCSGLVGADASSHVTIMNPADPHAGIVVDIAPGAPYSGVLDLACPLFPAADRLLHATFGFVCPRQHAGGEEVTFVTPEIARFMDPPGVKAVGALSGGPHAVAGALIYHAESDSLILAFQISCAMPPDAGPVCAAVVDDWVRMISTSYNVAQ